MLAMIMAMDRNRLIGADGGMPWHLPNELQYFKRVTMGKPLIMGRKTFESIGRPLPGRANIVVTGNTQWSHEGVWVAHDLETAIALAEKHKQGADEVMIIGGASLCRQAMPLTEKLYLTVIDHEFEGDTWLDSFEESDWQELSCEQVRPDEKNPYAYRCRVLLRKPL
ncbi:dihydrofolate reductase [Granulosicoccaceae sp. 1_MG-2023]|nr:dihydrofolate reductase [Granulosicoccaceae sp. 1_MG-2023]